MLNGFAFSCFMETIAGGEVVMVASPLKTVIFYMAFQQSTQVKLRNFNVCTNINVQSVFCKHWSREPRSLFTRARIFDVLVHIFIASKVSLVSTQLY